MAETDPWRELLNPPLTGHREKPKTNSICGALAETLEQLVPEVVAPVRQQVARYPRSFSPLATTTPAGGSVSVSGILPCSCVVGPPDPTGTPVGSAAEWFLFWCHAA